MRYIRAGRGPLRAVALGAALLLGGTSLAGCSGDGSNFNGRLSTNYSVTNCDGKPNSWAVWLTPLDQVARRGNEVSHVGLVGQYDAAGKPILADGARLDFSEAGFIGVEPLYGKPKRFVIGALATRQEFKTANGNTVHIGLEPAFANGDIPSYRQPNVAVQISCSDTPSRQIPPSLY